MGTRSTYRAVLFASFVILLGCGKNSELPPGMESSVSGTVTLDGQPVPGTVFFSSDTASSSCDTEPGGVYQLPNLPPGLYKVAVKPYEWRERKGPAWGVEGQPKVAIPAKYQDPK